MALTVLNTGDTDNDYGITGTRDTMTLGYVRDPAARYMVIVLASSTNPTWNSVTVDGHPATMAAEQVHGSNTRLQVWALDLTQVEVSASGDIVATAPSPGANKAVMSYLTIRETPLSDPALTNDDAGTGLSSATASYSGGYPAGLAIAADRASSTIVAINRGGSISSYVTNDGATNVSYRINDISASPPGIISATGSNVALILVGVNVGIEAPHQGWPRGGSVYAPLES